MRKNNDFCFVFIELKAPSLVPERMVWSSAYSRRGTRLCVKLLIFDKSLFVRFETKSFMNILKNVGLSVLPFCTPLHGIIAGRIPVKSSVV